MGAENSENRTARFILIFFIVVLAGLLAIYGIKGTYSRYAQDDYCYGYRVRDMGFWDMQIQSYIHKAEFNSDRYSLTFIHGLVELAGGPKLVPFLPLLEMIILFASLACISFQLQQLIFTRSNYLVAIVSALAITFFTVYMAPVQYQILFWLSAMQTYFTPIVLATFLLGCLISIARTRKLRFYHALGIGILSFFAGGFSETTGLWQFASWCILFGWLFISRKKSPIIKKASQLSLVAALSTGLALVVMALCPSNFTGRPFMHPALLEVMSEALKGGAQFIWVSLKAAPLPYFIVISLGFWLSCLIPYERKNKLLNILFEILAVVLILYIIAVANMVPIKLARYATSWPGARSLLPAHFSLVVCLFVIGWKLADSILVIKSNIFTFRLSRILQNILGIVLLIYIAHTTPRVYEKIQLYEARAKAWDVRQQMILEAKGDGKVDITVPQFDSVYGITELKPDSESWVNICAAKYYGIKSITAIEDFQGIPAYPIGK